MTIDGIFEKKRTSLIIETDNEIEKWGLIGKYDKEYYKIISCHGNWIVPRNEYGSVCPECKRTIILDK